MDVQSKEYFIGIQTNLLPLKVSSHITNQLQYISNNLGDCYESEKCPVPNTMEQERLAVEKVAQWLDLSPKECWGYIGGGSTLGNLQGMWMGTTLIPNATCVFTDAAHYSIPKFASALKFKKTKIIKTHPNGEIDLEDLKQQIEPKEHIVLILTAGTTMTSAYDPISPCTQILKDNECPFYFHLDAALGGFIIPFLDHTDFPTKDEYTFKNSDISSFTVSAHKVLGMPMPANIFIARQNVVKQFKIAVNKVPLLNNLEDITIYGSRDGFRASVVYDRLQYIQYQDIQNWVQTGIQLAHEFALKLQHEFGFKQTFALAGGLATVIPVQEYQRIFNETCRHKLEKKYHLVQDATYVHIYMMAHVNQQLCNEFIQDCYHFMNCA